MWGKEKAMASNTVGVMTLIARGTEIIGDIEFDGDLEVQGVVRGNICAKPATGGKGSGQACVRVVEGGRVQGEMRSPVVIVNGEVEGDIHASVQVELAAKAQVQGNVHYQVIEMVKGAQLNGNLIYASEPRLAAVATTEEPVAVKSSGS